MNKKGKTEFNKNGRKRFSTKQALEPRLLFDASIGVAHDVVEGLTSHADTSSHDHGVDKVVDKHIPDKPNIKPVQSEGTQKVGDLGHQKILDNQKSISDKISNLKPSEEKQQDLMHPKDTIIHTPMEGQGTQLLFIDRSVNGYHNAIFNVNGNTKIVELDPHQDVFAQITNSLAANHNISGVLLVTHKEAGNLMLGNDVISESSLQKHASDIASWNLNLSKDAKFVIYEKNVDQNQVDNKILSDFTNLVNNNVQSETQKTLNDTQNVEDGSVQDAQHAVIADELNNLFQTTDTEPLHAVTLGIHTESVLQDLSVTINPLEGSSGIIMTASELGSDRTYSLTGTDSSSFSIDSSGNLRFNSTPNYEEKSSYDVTINTYKNDVLTSTENVTVNVQDLAPVIISPACAYVLDAAPDATIVYVGVANDPAGGAVTYSLTGQDAALFAIDASTGVVTIKNSPNLQDKSSYNLELKASDPNGLSSSQSITINVTSTYTPNPEIPTYNVTDNVLQFDPDLFPVEGTGTGVVIGTAVDQTNNATYALVGPDKDAFKIDAGGKIKFLQVPDYETKNYYEFSVNTFYPGNVSGVPNSAELFKVYITNLAPVLGGPDAESKSVAEGISTSTTVFTATASDPAGGQIYFTIEDAVTGSNDASYFNITSTTNGTAILTFKDVPNFEGRSTYTIVIKASDAPNGTSFDTKTLTITLTDQPPVISSSNTANIVENSSANTVVYQVQAADPGGGTAVYSISGGDSNKFIINSGTGEVRFANNFVPDYEFKNTYNFTVTATVGAKSDSMGVSIHVLDQPATFTSATSVSIAENSPITTVVYTASAYDPEVGPSTPITAFTLTGADAGAFTLSPAGVLKFKNVPNYEGTQKVYHVTINAKNSNNTLTPFDVTINVTDIPPAFSSGTTATIAEGSPTSTVVYTAVASDPEGVSPITSYTLLSTDPDASYFDINTSNGKVTFRNPPNFETQVTYSIHVIATNSNGTSASQPVTVTLTNVAPAFTSGNTGNTIPEGSTTDSVYQAAATDVAGGSVSYSLVSGSGDSNLFKIDALGFVTFINPPDFESRTTPYSITVKASDSSNASTTKTVTIPIVTDVAPAFTSGDTGNAIPEGSTTDSVYQAAATDVAGGTVSYSLVSGSGDSNLFKIDASGKVTFINPPDFESRTTPYIITVKASDPSGAFSTKTVTIPIVTNVAPAFTSGGTGNAIPEGSTTDSVYQAAATDVAGGTVTYSLVAGSGDSDLFKVDASGKVTFINPPDFESRTTPYIITVKASDPSGAFSTKTVTIPIVTNVAPAFTSGDTGNAIPEGSTTDSVYQAAATDVAGGAVNYSLVAGSGDSDLFKIDASGKVTFINPPDFESRTTPYSITVKASDSSNAFSIKTVTIPIVTDVAPAFTSGGTGNTIPEGSTTDSVYQAAATDVAGGTVSYSLVSGSGDSDLFKIDALGFVTFINPPDFESRTTPYIITVKASDSSNVFSTKTVTIPIVTNVAPAFTSGGTGNAIPEGSTTDSVYQAAATDVAGGTVTYSLVAGSGDSDLFKVDASGKVTFINPPDFESRTTPYIITVKASDSSNAFSTKTVTIPIVTNVAPAFTSGDTGNAIPEGSTTDSVYQAAATDVAGGAVNYSLVAGSGDSDLFKIDASGKVTFINPPDYESRTTPYIITVKASDSSNAFSTKIVTIPIVTDVAPVFTSGGTGNTIPEGSTTDSVYQAAATDVAGGAVTYSLVSGSGDSNLFKIDALGFVTFIDPPDFESRTTPYSITVKASDSSNVFSTKTVTIPIVTNVAPAFTSGDTGNTIPEGSTTDSVYQAAATDVAGGTVSYSLVAGSGDSDLFKIDASGDVTFINPPDFESRTTPYSITVKASDSSNAFSIKTVTIPIVTDVAPEFTSGGTGNAIPEGSTTDSVYQAAATDVAGGTVTYSLVAGSGDSDLFKIDASGKVTFINPPDFESRTTPYIITVKASDPSGEFTTKTVTIPIVTDVAPAFTSGGTGNTIPEGSTTDSVYHAIATDVAGGTVTYSLVAGSGDSDLFEIDASGFVTFIDPPDFESRTTPYIITVKASDPSGEFTTKTVTIPIVTNVAPEFTSGDTGNAIPEGSTTDSVYQAIAEDVAGGSVSYSLVAGSGDSDLFKIDASGKVTFKNPPDFESRTTPYIITVKASDPSGEFTTKIVTIPIVTDVAPAFTSGGTGNAIPEGSTTDSVYQAAATDVAGGTVSYSLVSGSGDSDLFKIDASGKVTFKNPPDFESRTTPYIITVKASDPSGESTTKTVTIPIVTNVAPTITSGDTGNTIPEGSTTDSVYHAIAVDVAGGTVTYSLVAGSGDSDLFKIDASGFVTFIDPPDFESRTTPYIITVKASDSSNAFSTKIVTIPIVTDVAPVFTSGDTGNAIPEGSTTDSVYQAIAIDSAGGTVTYSLVPGSGDSGLFEIDASGKVTFIDPPDYESRTTPYTITVKATNPSGEFTNKIVTIPIVTNVAPEFTSGDTGNAIPEGSTTDSVYQAIAEDVAGGTVSYSLVAGSGDSDLFKIDASGNVTFINPPDFESRTTPYSITVKASDPSGESTTMTVTIPIVTDVPPEFTSDGTGNAIPEGSTTDSVYQATAVDVAGGAVNYSLVAGSGDSNLFKIDASGKVTFINPPDFESRTTPYIITVKASDPSGAFSTKTVTIPIVTDVAPEFTSGDTGNAIPEGSTTDSVYQAAATDVAGGTVNYSLVAGSGDSDLFEIDASGKVTFINPPDFESRTTPYIITVKASDPSGESTNMTVTIPIVTNVAPEFTSGDTGNTIPEGSTTDSVYQAIAEDVAGGAVNYSLVAGSGDSDLFKIDASGKVTFKNPPDFESRTTPYIITVRASDPSGESTTKTVTIPIVTDVAPEFTSGGTGNAIPEGSTTDSVYQAAATDVAGGTVSYSLVPGSGDSDLFEIDASGKVTFIDPPDFESRTTSYSITVKASDPSGESTTKTVTIPIVTNVAPEFTSGDTGNVIPEGSTTDSVYQAIAEDVAGGTVNYSLVAGSGDSDLFEIDASGFVTFIDPPDFESRTTPYSITVKASDPSGESTTMIVTIPIVTDVAPEFTSGGTGNAIPEGSTTDSVYQAIAEDVAGGTVNYSLVAGSGDSDLFKIDASGKVTFINPPDFESRTTPYIITVRASDPSGESTTKTVTIPIVTDVAPEFTSGDTGNAIPEGSTTDSVYQAAATDVAGGTVSYSLVPGSGDSDLFEIDASGKVTFRDPPDFESRTTSYSITVKASDPSGESTTKTVTIPIVTNVAPEFTSGDTGNAIPEGSTTDSVYQAVAEDVAGGTVNYSLVSGSGDSDLFKIDASGNVTFIDPPDFESGRTTPYIITVKASDPSGESITKTVTIPSVTNVAPAFTSGGTGNAIPEGSTTDSVYQAIAEDVAGGTVNYSLVAGSGDSDLFKIDASGKVTFINPPDFESRTTPYIITVKASDPSGESTTKTVTIPIVTDVAPEFTSGDTGNAIPEGSTTDFVYQAAATDVAGGAVNYSLVPGSGDSDLFKIDASGDVTFINPPDFESRTTPYIITVRASDPSGESTTKTVTIPIVTNVAPAFTSGDTGNAIPEGSTTDSVYQAIAEDVAGGTVNYSLVAGSGDSDLFEIDASGKVTFINPPDFESRTTPYIITVRASDPSGESTTKTVTIPIVTNVAPAFTSGDRGNAIPEGSTTDSVYQAIAEDVAGGTVTYSLVAGSRDSDLFKIDASGKVTFINPPDYESRTTPYIITIIASDPSHAFSTKTVTIPIVTNLAPEFSSPTTVTIGEGTTVVYKVAANDPGGGAVTYSLASGGDSYLFNINAVTGDVTFKGDHNYKSSYNIRVIAMDPSGAMSEQSVLINNTTKETDAGGESVPNTQNNRSDSNVSILNALEASKVYQTQDSSPGTFLEATGIVSHEHELEGDINYRLSEGVLTTKIFNTLVFDTANKGTFGTLYVNSKTGEYLYERNKIALHPKVSSVSERFNMQVSSDGVIHNIILSVKIFSNNIMSVGAFMSPDYAPTTQNPMDFLAITKGMGGQVVLGAVVYQPDDKIQKANMSNASANLTAKVKKTHFTDGLTTLLKDFGLM